MSRDLEGLQACSRRLENTTRGDGSAVPGVVAEDPVCLRDDVPALDIIEGGTTGDARLHMLGIEFLPSGFSFACR
jgi:hypothetical protein